MAAEEALKKLEEQLNCPICLDTYTDPKLLPCHHVYCRKCLVKLVIRDQQGDLVLTCPHCRQVTPVPPRGVTGLQSAFHMNHLLEIHDSLQKLRVAPVTVEEAAGGDSSSLKTVKASYCSEHSEKELELYCETCGKLICFHCAIKGGKHHSHDHQLLNDAYEKYRKEIISSFEPLEVRLAATNKALEHVVNRCEVINNQQAHFEAEIHGTMRRLREILYARETSLVDHLHKLTQAKLKELAVQKDQLETIQAQFSSCLEFMKESLKAGSQVEVLRMKATIVKQAEEVTTILKPDVFRAEVKADLVFSAKAKFENECFNFGQLTMGGSLILNESVTMEVVRMPYHVYEGMAAPWGVVINSHGEIIVTEELGNCVSRFAVYGDRLPSFGEAGPEEGKFSVPYGVAVDDADNILVIDCENHRLQKFTSEGQFLTEVGGYGSGQLEFVEPKDLAINPKNHKIYIIEDNCRVQVLNPDLTFFSTFGSCGKGEGQFGYPCGITLDNSGSVYVADSGNDRVQVFTAEGKFIKQFGSDGSSKLRMPIGIAVHSGLVYVSEYFNHCVSVFTTEGKLVMRFGRQGNTLGEFRGLANLMVQNDTLYVCDRFNGRIQAFHI